jgi:hypothetical protein
MSISWFLYQAADQYSQRAFSTDSFAGNLPGLKNKEGGGMTKKRQDFLRQNHAGHPWLGNIKKYSTAGSGSYFMRKGNKTGF